MQDQWFPNLDLPLTFEQFEKLPRNAAYKYEYSDGQTWLTPRPKYYHTLLELNLGEVCRRVDGPWPVVVRPLDTTDWDRLAPVFAGAFRGVQPFGSLDDERRLKAARQCLDRTRTAGDGPLIEQASFVAVKEDDDHCCGAALITLWPLHELTDWDAARWTEPPPPGCIERRQGRPHLTWVFVSPLFAGHGVGTALLSTAAAELIEMGYRELASTFLVGNESSMLWHWRNGFRLLAYPGSPRRRVRPKREEESVRGASR